MVVTGCLVWMQQKALSGRSYTTVAGKAFRPRPLNLGPWRFLTLAMAMVYLLVVVVLPSIALFIAAFRKFLFIRDIPSLFDAKQYGWQHFVKMFDNPLTITSIVNSMKVGVITAVVGGTLAFAIGYTVTRSRAPGRRVIWSLASPICGRGSAFRSGCMVRCGYWPWHSSPASCRTPSRPCPPR